MGEHMRRSWRVPVHFPVRWRRGRTVVECTLADMNVHGMFLRTTEDFEPGQLMALEIVLPSRTICAFVTARVVGATLQGRGIGAELFLLSREDRDVWMRTYAAECRRHGTEVGFEPAIESPRRAASAPGCGEIHEVMQ